MTIMLVYLPNNSPIPRSFSLQKLNPGTGLGMRLLCLRHTVCGWYDMRVWLLSCSQLWICSVIEFVGGQSNRVVVAQLIGYRRVCSRLRIRATTNMLLRKKLDWLVAVCNRVTDCVRRVLSVVNIQWSKCKKEMEFLLTRNLQHDWGDRPSCE